MRGTAALVLLAALALAGCGDSAEGVAAPPVSSAPSPSSSAASDPVVVTVAENDGNDARSAIIGIRQLVYVDLATCGGCGFEWTVDTPPTAAVAAGEDTAQPAQSGAPAGTAPLPGAATTTRLAFRGVGGGSTKVSLGYHGPAKAGPDRLVVLTITVKSKGLAGSSAG